MSWLSTGPMEKCLNGKQKMMNKVKSELKITAMTLMIFLTFLFEFPFSSNNRMDFIPVDADFSDTAVINICSNVEYSSKPLVWTFSTYLNIIGHRFDDMSNHIFAKFSTLPIGMFALRECPHDPNK